MARKKLFGRNKPASIPAEEEVTILPDPKEEEIIIEPQPVEEEIPPVKEVEIEPQVALLADEHGEPYGKEAPLYNVKITVGSLRRREAPNLNAKVTGYITDYGTYQIFDERDGWGQLKEFDWIKLEFTKKV